MVVETLTLAIGSHSKSGPRGEPQPPSRRIEAMPDADIEFFWDPICPFAWLTSRWVTDVAQQRDYEVVVSLAEWPSFAELKRSKRDDLVFPPV